jgi:hypothetical protein
MLRDLACFRSSSKSGAFQKNVGRIQQFSYETGKGFKHDPFHHGAAKVPAEILRPYPAGVCTPA